MSVYQARNESLNRPASRFNWQKRQGRISADAFGEMPTQPLISARQRGYRIYLPVVTGKHQPLVFIEFTQKLGDNLAHPNTHHRVCANLIKENTKWWRLMWAGLCCQRQPDDWAIVWVWVAVTRLHQPRLKVTVKIGAYDFQLVDKLTAILGHRLMPSSRLVKLWIF